MKTIKVNGYDDLINIDLNTAIDSSILIRRKDNITLVVVYCLPYYHLTGLVYINGLLANTYPQYTGFDNLKAGKTILSHFENEIFTNEELEAPLKDYQDYRRREDFIDNIIPSGYDHINIFQKDFDKKVKDYPYKSTIGIDYFKDEKVAKKISDLYLSNISKNDEMMKINNAYFKTAVDYELANFETSISGDPSDALMQLQINPHSLNHVQLSILNDSLKKCYCEAF
jgi:hypothetical protein